MYRSSTGKFLLSLTPFDSFDYKLLETSIEDKYYDYFDNSNGESVDAFQHILKPPICYSEYNKFLRFFISQLLFLSIDDNFFRFLPYRHPYCANCCFGKILDIYNGIFQNDNINKYKSQSFRININGEREGMGICLYKINLNNFKITKYKYIHPMGLLYDILNSYENCNYFIKIFDSNKVIYTFADKLTINTFIKTLNSYMSYYPQQINYHKVKTYLFSATLYYYLFSYQLYTNPEYIGITNNFEIVRNELKNIRTSKMLQINTSTLCKYDVVPNISQLLSSSSSTENEFFGSTLKYLVDNRVNFSYHYKKLVRFVKYGDNSSKLEKYGLHYGYDRFQDFIIYEKDISYYICDWWVLIHEFICYCKYFLYLPIIEAKDFSTNILSFYDILKNYEKSKYFYTKNDFNNKILNNGISL